MAGRRNGKTEMLRRVGLLSACNDKELRQIGRLTTEVQASEGQQLCREGEAGREFYLIADGRAKVSRGKRKLAELGPGQFFGEMSLLDAGPRTATVTALTSMTMYVLDAREFSSMLEASPAIARKIMRGLAGRLRGSEASPSH